jgi:hypothetical protein
MTLIFVCVEVGCSRVVAEEIQVMKRWRRGRIYPPSDIKLKNHTPPTVRVPERHYRSQDHRVNMCFC